MRTLIVRAATARHWEETGVAFGGLLVLANVFALVTPYLSGPLFHPVLILAGAFLVYVCGMFLAGAGRDQEDRS